MPSDADSKDERWELGLRAALVHTLRTTLSALGKGGEPEVALGRLVREREEAVASLRRVCDQHGDNEWPNDLHLSDIIEKHLVRGYRP